MSKVTRQRLRELAMHGAVATPEEVRALVLEVKGARALIERFEAALIEPRELGTITPAPRPSTVIN
jgi:hypothetical protein